MATLAVKAREYAENKEQATEREWSAHGNVRMEAYRDGYQKAIQDVAGALVTTDDMNYRWSSKDLADILVKLVR